jgi:hypothetical protein
MNQVQIRTEALLAAILFNVDKTEEVEIRQDDSAESRKVACHIVGIETEGDACVCVVPLEKVLHFAQTTYDFRVRIDNKAGMAVIELERRKDGGGILTATGKPVVTQSPAIRRCMERLNG